MEPGRPLRRLYWIDASLQKNLCPNARLLATELGASADTIRRDLARLRDRFKAPVLYDPSAGGFRYGHPFVPDLPDLPLDEAVELGRAWQHRGGIAGTALERTVRRMLDALLAVMGDGQPAPVNGAAGRSGAAEAGREAGSAPARAGTHPLDGAACASSKRLARPVQVRVRFDAAAGKELLAGGFLRREEAQMLTDGGLETVLATRDPDALMLALLRWAPHFDVAAPAWVRRRLAILLRGLLRHWEGPPASGRRSRERDSRRRRAAKS